MTLYSFIFYNRNIKNNLKKNLKHDKKTPVFSTRSFRMMTALRRATNGRAEGFDTLGADKKTTLLNLKPEDDGDRPAKKQNGRRRGYRMQPWQKSLQNQSIKDKDLDYFQRFLCDFMSVIRSMRGREFYIKDDRDARDGICAARNFDDEKIYVLESVSGGRGTTQDIFYFRNVALRWKIISFKGFDLYESFRDRTLFPVDDESRLTMQVKVYSYVWQNRRVENKREILDWLREEMEKIHPQMVDTVEAFLEESAPDVGSDEGIAGNGDFVPYGDDDASRDVWRRVEECLASFAAEGCLSKGGMSA